MQREMEGASLQHEACICAADMASYNVIIPTITALCDHIGVSDSAVGLIIGMCDIATIFGTVGKCYCKLQGPVSACATSSKLLHFPVQISCFWGYPCPCCRMSFQRRCGINAAGYSIWTSTSYKAPLIASAVACLLGNVAYCLSFDLRSLWLLVLARLITGFGEALLPLYATYTALLHPTKDVMHARTKVSSLAHAGSQPGIFVHEISIGPRLGPSAPTP